LTAWSPALRRSGAEFGLRFSERGRIRFYRTYHPRFDRKGFCRVFKGEAIRFSRFFRFDEQRFCSRSRSDDKRIDKIAAPLVERFRKIGKRAAFPVKRNGFVRYAKRVGSRRDFRVIGEFGR